MSTRRLASWLLLGALLGCRDPLAGPPGTTEADKSRAKSVVSSAPPPNIQFPMHASFQGGAIELLGSTLEPNKPQAGKPLFVTQYWKVNRPVGAWKLFAHLAVPQGNQMQMVGNRDHEAAEGAYPVSQWKAGDVVADRWALQLPPNAPPQLAVLVGLWNDQGRMAVDPPQPGETTRSDGQGRVFAAMLDIDQGGPPIPRYQVPRLQGALKIDGVLDDEAWKRAPETPPFTRSFDGAAPHTACRARLLWDDQFLYASFDVQDEDVWGSHRKKDDPIYGEEVVELFIDADGDGRTYNELEISPHNVQFDAAFEARRSDLPKAMAWESGMESAVKVQGTLDDGSDVDRGWTVEVKIPIANLYAVPHVPPKPGDVWRFNLYRLDWWGSRKNNEGQAYSPPLVGDFHHLPRFAYLEFAP